MVETNPILSFTPLSKIISNHSKRNILTNKIFLKSRDCILSNETIPAHLQLIFTKIQKF